MTSEPIDANLRKVYNYEEDKRRMRAVCDRLEEKYAERRLKFAHPFDGISPSQADGYLDGMIFYYRFRGDKASLQVGTPDWGNPQRQYDEEVISRKQRIDSVKEAMGTGEISRGEAGEMLRSLSREPFMVGVDEFYPDIVHQSAVIENVTGSRYAGMLSDTFTEFIFTELMAALR